MPYFLFSRMLALLITLNLSTLANADNTAKKIDNNQKAPSQSTLKKPNASSSFMIKSGKELKKQSADPLPTKDKAPPKKNAIDTSILTDDRSSMHRKAIDWLKTTHPYLGIAPGYSYPHDWLNWTLIEGDQSQDFSSTPEVYSTPDQSWYLGWQINQYIGIEYQKIKLQNHEYRKYNSLFKDFLEDELQGLSNEPIGKISNQTRGIIALKISGFLGNKFEKDTDYWFKIGQATVTETFSILNTGNLNISFARPAGTYSAKVGYIAAGYDEPLWNKHFGYTLSFARTAGSNNISPMLMLNFGLYLIA